MQYRMAVQSIIFSFTFTAVHQNSLLFTIISVRCCYNIFRHTGLTISGDLTRELKKNLTLVKGICWCVYTLFL